MWIGIKKELSVISENGYGTQQAFKIRFLQTKKIENVLFFVVSDLLINSGHVIKHTQYIVFIIYLLVLLPPAVQPNYCVESA